MTPIAEVRVELGGLRCGERLVRDLLPCPFRQVAACGLIMGEEQQTVHVGALVRDDAHTPRPGKQRDDRLEEEQSVQHHDDVGPVTVEQLGGGDCDASRRAEEPRYVSAAMGRRQRGAAQEPLDRDVDQFTEWEVTERHVPELVERQASSSGRSASGNEDREGLDRKAVCRERRAGVSAARVTRRWGTFVDVHPIAGLESASTRRHPDIGTTAASTRPR